MTDAAPAIGPILRAAKSLYVSGCAAEIGAVRDLLRRHPPSGATVTGVFNPSLNRHSYADAEIGLRFRTFFLNPDSQRDLALGLVEFCPWRYGVMDRWLSAKDRFDTALVMISPPNGNGRCSLGPQVDFLPRFHDRIGTLIGFVNPCLPRTVGDGDIDLSAFATLVDYHVPLLTVEGRSPDAAATAIARSIAELVPDGATLQFGIGQVPSAVMAGLRDHRRLRVHTGLVDDNILLLEEGSALDRIVPIVTGAAVGSRRLYDAIDRNRRFSFRSVCHTHAFRVVADTPRFVAVNSALQIDLLGQINAEADGGRLVASPGGLPDFTRGALASEDGCAITAIRARGRGGARGIVALLDAPHAVSTPRVDADIIVTEHGVASIRTLSVDARADALIAIADPQDRDCLAAAWRAFRNYGRRGHA